jgi:hypothetical protein
MTVVSLRFEPEAAQGAAKRPAQKALARAINNTLKVNERIFTSLSFKYTFMIDNNITRQKQFGKGFA